MNHFKGLRFDRTQPAHLKNLPWNDQDIWPKVMEVFCWLCLFGVVFVLLFVVLALEQPLGAK